MVGRGTVLLMAILGGCVDPPVGRHLDPPPRTWNLGKVVVRSGPIRLIVHPHWYAYTGAVVRDARDWRSVRGENDASLCLGIRADDGKPHALFVEEAVLISEKERPLRSPGSRVTVGAGPPTWISFSFLPPRYVQLIGQGAYRRVRFRGRLDETPWEETMDLADWIENAQ